MLANNHVSKQNCSCFLLHCEKLYLLCQNAPMTIYGAGGSEVIAEATCVVGYQSGE